MLMRIKKNRVNPIVAAIPCRMKIQRYDMFGGFVNAVIIIGFK